MIVCASVCCFLSVISFSPNLIPCHRGLVCQLAGLSFGKWAADPNDGRDPVLISQRQQFIVPAITYQRRIVRRRDSRYSRLPDCASRQTTLSARTHWSEMT